MSGAVKANDASLDVLVTVRIQIKRRAARRHSERHGTMSFSNALVSGVRPKLAVPTLMAVSKQNMGASRTAGR